MMQLLCIGLILAAAPVFLSDGYSQLDPFPPVDAENCITLSAERLDGDRVELTYQCDVSRYEFSGVPVDIYLGATAFSSATSSSGVTCGSPRACGVDEYLDSGDLYLLDGGGGASRYTGTVGQPSWSRVSFPPVPISGTGIVEVPDEMTVRFAIVLLRSGSGEFIRTDGLPVELSDCLSPVTSSGARQAR
jgi:hypothetical protein